MRTPVSSFCRTAQTAPAFQVKAGHPATACRPHQVRRAQPGRGETREAVRQGRRHVGPKEPCRLPKRLLQEHLVCGQRDVEGAARRLRPRRPHLHQRLLDLLRGYAQGGRDLLRLGSSRRRRRASATSAGRDAFRGVTAPCDGTSLLPHWRVACREMLPSIIPPASRPHQFTLKPTFLWHNARTWLAAALLL